MKLLEPYQLGPLTLKNRTVMAPLTRNRATGTVPQPVHAHYYAQRAGAGLIVSEATQVAPLGQGYPDTPGIHSAEQTDAWKTVTDAVHAAGGIIYLQLWHVGRVSHSSYHGGAKPVSASAVKFEGNLMYPDFSRAPSDETPRALETDEVAEVVQQYRQAAENARQAGFDGRGDSRGERLLARAVPAHRHGTSAPTATAAALKTEPGFLKKSPRPS